MNLNMTTKKLVLISILAITISVLIIRPDEGIKIATSVITGAFALIQTND